MGIIFYFSSRNADESAEQSGKLLIWLSSILGDNLFTTFIIRKSAHLLEFTGLSVLFNSALYFTKGRREPILAVLLTSAYAITDEIHQIFVIGRSCELRDWSIDTLGAVIGTIGFLILFYIIDRIVKKFKQK